MKYVKLILFICILGIAVICGCNRESLQIESEGTTAFHTTEPGETKTTAEDETTSVSGTEYITEPQTEPPTEPQTEPQPEPPVEPISYIPYPENGKDIKFRNYVIPEYIYNLDSTYIPLGINMETAALDKMGRPQKLVDLQSLYGEKYNAVFIGSKEKEIYLTFTMGYEYYNDGIANTQRIMDICLEKNVPVIFFVDGGYVRYNAQMCQKIVENGFELGCHGYAHPSDGIATHTVEEQVYDVNLIWHVLYETTGVEPRYYRFGNSIWNERALALLDSLGFKTIFHSFAYRDWVTTEQPDPGETLQKMINSLHSGEIIYLHTVSNTSVEVLPEFIDAARERGYEFGMIPYE
ncbi:MAG: polysaccharide deacetylase family protein [Butyrivibrio sp.]